MDVRIGVTQSPKEIELDLGEVDREALKDEIAGALAKGEGVLWLTDRKGRTVGIPAAKVAYVEIGSASEERRVGFGR